MRQQQVALEAKQGTAALGGVALAALQIAHAEFRAPVFLANAQQVEGH